MYSRVMVVVYTLHVALLTHAAHKPGCRKPGASNGQVRLATMTSTQGGHVIVTMHLGLQSLGVEQVLEYYTGNLTCSSTNVAVQQSCVVTTFVTVSRLPLRCLHRTAGCSASATGNFAPGGT